MCCRSGQEGEQSLGNPADTRQSKKRLTRMLIGSKNCCKYPTSIQIIPSKPFSSRAQHVLADSYATGPALKIHCSPPTANLWSGWSPQKRVTRDKLNQQQKVRKSCFNQGGTKQWFWGTNKVYKSPQFSFPSRSRSSKVQ